MPLSITEAESLYERVFSRFVVDDARPGIEPKVRAELPDPAALFAYYGCVSETRSPEADLRFALDMPWNARSRIGQPLQGVFRYGWHLGTDAMTAAPWARTFLPRRHGRIAEARPVLPAFGKVKLMFWHGVDVAYATALFAAYPGMDVPAERIIELWDQGVSDEYARVLMAGR